MGCRGEMIEGELDRGGRGASLWLGERWCGFPRRTLPLLSGPYFQMVRFSLSLVLALCKLTDCRNYTYKFSGLAWMPKYANFTRELPDHGVERTSTYHLLGWIGADF